MIKAHLTKFLGIGFVLWSIGLFFYADHNGYKRSDDKWKLKEAQKVEKGFKTHAEIKHKNITLSDPDLDNRLLKWVK